MGVQTNMKFSRILSVFAAPQIGNQTLIAGDQLKNNVWKDSAWSPENYSLSIWRGSLWFLSPDQQCFKQFYCTAMSFLRSMAWHLHLSRFQVGICLTKWTQQWRIIIIYMKHSLVLKIRMPNAKSTNFSSEIFMSLRIWCYRSHYYYYHYYYQYCYCYY